MTKCVLTLLDQATAAPAIPKIIWNQTGPSVIHGTVEGTGAVSTTLTWYGNTVGSDVGAIVIATQSLSGTDLATDGAPITAEWPFIFCVPSAITGTGAKVTARIAV